MFEYEHIIRLNLIDSDRRRLWTQLVDFSRRPENYVEEITRSESDEARGTSEGVEEFERRTWFGRHEIKEKVVLVEEDSISFNLLSVNGSPVQSFFGIKIEEPEEKNFFLRFSYKTPMTKEEKQYPQIEGLKKQAYQQKDLAMVQKLLEKMQ